MPRVISASEHRQWRDALADFSRVDVCQLPEYHQAYSLRFKAAQPLMWCYQDLGESLCYPFLLSPVILHGADGSELDTGYMDISGIYGYSGPVASSADEPFLSAAWRSFDEWALQQRVVSEFIRFSAYVGNKDWAHPATSVEYNRPVAIALLPGDAGTFMAQLNSKTRNMIRKASKSDLVAREVGVSEALGDFRDLYQQTMGRNQATDFFMYDDAYYQHLLSLPEGELMLFAAYQDNTMVAAAMGLVHDDMAFYHLGASTLEASRLGAGNLVLYAMAAGLIERGVGYFSVGGGRTTAADDPLYRFKKSNATSVAEFHIGTRIIQQEAYDSIVKSWETMNNTGLTTSNLQFYR
jgi:hypothetical protein